MASAKRPLTAGEWSSLSHGLAEALRLAAAAPRIVPAAHPAARVSSLWRGKTPILTRGDEIWWPGAPADFAGDEAALPILQHELQHVLEYAQGRLTAAAYIVDPRNWTYQYKLTPTSRWADFGAEQRASIVETLWRIEHDKDRKGLAAHRKLIPWARP
jgi:hypothetical protein